MDVILWSGGGAFVKRKKPGRRGGPEEQLPGLRAILERVRLEILSLVRALDRLGLFQDRRPAVLTELGELDADFAEALWVLDQKKLEVDLVAMVRDLHADLEELPKVCERLLGQVPGSLRARVLAVAGTLLKSLSEREAYNDIPGRDPTAVRVR